MSKSRKAQSILEYTIILAAIIGAIIIGARVIGSKVKKGFDDAGNVIATQTADFNTSMSAKQ